MEFAKKETVLDTLKNGGELIERKNFGFFYLAERLGGNTIARVRRDTALKIIREAESHFISDGDLTIRYYFKG